MKKNVMAVIVCLALATSSCISTQDRATLTPAENMVQLVVEFPGKSQAVLYRASQEWMVRQFVSAQSVIQYQDKDEGVISGKGLARFNVGGLGATGVDFVITIEVKDGKSRLTFRDFYFADVGRDPIVSSMAHPTKINLPYFQEWAQEFVWDYEEGVRASLGSTW